MEHEGPDDNAEVFVHDGDTFRAAALNLRPLASSRYGARVYVLVLDEDGPEAGDFGCGRYLAFGFSLISREYRGEHDEPVQVDLLAVLCDGDEPAVFIGGHRWTGTEVL